MINLNPINQTKLFCLDKYISKLIRLFDAGKFPNKLLLSGQKGLGKSTLAYHFINYVLSKNEDFEYDIDKFEINPENKSFKTVINKSNPNLIIIDLKSEKKTIEISQIRDLISNLNKSSFNEKPRFVLLDNIEYLNINSINALLKILEEPSFNIYFILINSNKRMPSTLLSRCVNFKITLSNNESLEITEKLLNGNLDKLIDKDLINYYITPGNIYNLVLFAQSSNIDLSNINLRQFLKILIKDNHYKKNNIIRSLIFDLIEFYFRKINLPFSSKVSDDYSKFIKRISYTKKFNLDEESLFMQFDKEILDG